MFNADDKLKREVENREPFKHGKHNLKRLQSIKQRLLENLAKV